MICNDMTWYAMRSCKWGTYGHFKIAHSGCRAVQSHLWSESLLVIRLLTVILPWLPCISISTSSTPFSSPTPSAPTPFFSSSLSDISFSFCFYFPLLSFLSTLRHIASHHTRHNTWQTRFRSSLSSPSSCWGRVRVLCEEAACHHL